MGKQDQEAKAVMPLQSVHVTCGLCTGFQTHGAQHLQVHLVLDGHKHGGDVLASIAGDGKHNEAQEGLPQTALVSHVLQRPG
jgi:hypothetical protein